MDQDVGSRRGEWCRLKIEETECMVMCREVGEGIGSLAQVECEIRLW